MSLVVVAGISALMLPRSAPAQDPPGAGAGQLVAVAPDGKTLAPLTLTKTQVNAQIAGFGARVTVHQHFTNPCKTPIEAVYTFPLPDDAAVDHMRMRIGDRVVEGQIKTRSEARKVYETAREAGQSAALLDQERPNVFTQSVANVMPGKAIDIEISYVQTLKYENGQFEFSFPMVVGPRFTDHNTPDPGKISPPIVAKGARSGQTIDLHVSLAAGAPIQALSSVLHKIDVTRPDDSHAEIDLAKRDEIPNRDFILRYQVSTDSVQSSFVTDYEGQKGGFFSLVLLPPKVPKASQIEPREVIFVMDQSGSQMGFPIEKSKELTLRMLKTLRPGDTFNVVGFADTARSLWPEPRPNTPENLQDAEAFIKPMQGNGGTQLREGLIASLQKQNDAERLRLVVFNTDGYVGDENLILDTIQKQRDHARIFTFGIGNSVNRYLIDAMSVEGRGDAEYVTLNEKADSAVARFVERTQTPILTDLKATFEGVAATDLTPSPLPDVFNGHPVILMGRYDKPGQGRLVVSGKLGGKPWSQTLDVDLSGRSGDSAIPVLWARRKIDDLKRTGYMAPILGEREAAPQKKIQDLALEFGIMSETTSFVAVDNQIVNKNGVPKTVAAPVEMPEGVSYDGIFGPAPTPTLSVGVAKARSIGGSFGGGFGGVAAGGAGGVSAAAPMNAQWAPAAGGYSGFAGKPQARSAGSNISPLLVGKAGRLHVRITLAHLTAPDLKALRKAGFTLKSQNKKQAAVVGFVDAVRLSEVAALKFVKFVEPVHG